MIRQGILLAPILVVGIAGPLLAGEPSFDCAKARNEVEEAICADSTLAALDVKMSAVWSQTMSLIKDSNERTMLEGEQQSWTGDRDACSKNSDMRSCIESKYKTRIAELQARWRLIPGEGPFAFECGASPASKVVATYFDTDPPSARLERGGQIVIVFRAAAASGAKYEGRHVTFWTKGRAARIKWGLGAEELECVLRGPEK